LWNNGQKWPKTGETQSLPFGHFIKNLGEAVNLGQLKEACTNFFGAHSSRGVKPTLRPFYKEFGRGRKFGPHGIETDVQKFFLGSTPAETKGFCSYFSVQGSGKSALSFGKPDRNGRKRARGRTYPSAIL